MDNRYAPTPPTEAAKALEELKTLPSLEDTQAQLEGVIETITAEVAKIIPSVSWRRADNEALAGCNKPYDQSDGHSWYAPNTIASDVVVSEADWPKILEIAKATAARVNASEIQVFQDKPGKHDIRLYGPAGLFVRVGYAGNLNIGGYTGCRLLAAKK